eukprot:scpid104939/ scgid13086/ 
MFCSTEPNFFSTETPTDSNEKVTKFLLPEEVSGHYWGSLCSTLLVVAHTMFCLEMLLSKSIWFGWAGLVGQSYELVKFRGIVSCNLVVNYPAISLVFSYDAPDPVLLLPAVCVA